MARDLKQIEEEIAELTRRLFEEEHDVWEFEKIARRRREVIIERRQAERPVYEQKYSFQTIVVPSWAQKKMSNND